MLKGKVRRRLILPLHKFFYTLWNLQIRIHPLILKFLAILCHKRKEKLSFSVSQPIKFFPEIGFLFIIFILFINCNSTSSISILHNAFNVSNTTIAQSAYSLLNNIAIESKLNSINKNNNILKFKRMTNENSLGILFFNFL